MWAWLAVALAAPPSLIPLDPIEPPSGYRAGAFDAAPVLQWRARLPGPPMNTSVHAEHTRPLPVGQDALLVGSAAGEGMYLLARRDGSLIRHFSTVLSPEDETSGLASLIKKEEPAPAGSSVEAEAAVVGDRVYFSDVGGGTWCFALSGERLWHHDGNAPILVRPVVHEGILYVTNVDDLALALDAETGELVWRYQARPDLGREAELALYAAPPAVINGDEVLLGFSDGSLVSLNHRTGEEHWSKRIGEGRYPDLVAEPTAYGSDLYASGYFRPLVALDRESHEVRWRLDSGAAAAVVVDERQDPATVYHPGSDGTLRAVSALTGALRWEWDSGTSGALTTPVITPAGLVVASSQGGIYLIDAETGEPTWRWREPMLLLGVSSQPVVDGRQLFFVSNAGWLYAFVVPRS